MKLGYVSSAAAASAPDQPPARKPSRGVKTKKEEKEMQQMRELLNNVSRLALSNAVASRVLKAVVIKCVKIPTNSQWVTIHKGARAEFIEDQQKAKQMGSRQTNTRRVAGFPVLGGRMHGSNT